MKAILKLKPLTFPPQKEQVVVYENVCRQMESKSIFLCYGDKIDSTFMLSGGSLITGDKLFEIICEVPDTQFYENVGDGTIPISEFPKTIPLHYDDYDSALKRMRENIDAELEVEIKLMDVLGMTNHNLSTSIAKLVRDGYNNRSWDDIIQDIAEKHQILIDHRVQEFLEENYRYPQSKKYKV